MPTGCLCAVPVIRPGGQSLERLASGEARSRSRNPLIVQGLAWLELMDERGSGISRMTRLMEQAGHPAPAFTMDHDSLVLELRPAEPGVSEPAGIRPSDDASEQTPREAILQEVKASGTISTKICVQKLGIPRATAQRVLSTLVDEQVLEKTGTGPKICYGLRNG